MSKQNKTSQFQYQLYEQSDFKNEVQDNSCTDKPGVKLMEAITAYKFYVTRDLSA